MNMESNILRGYPQEYNNISWSAIFVGAFIASGLSFLLQAFNSGLGLSAFSTNAEGLKIMVVGGLIWLLICGFISMLVAGWIAGVLARPVILSRCGGVLHGFTAWCVAVVMYIILASYAGIAAMSGTAESTTMVQRPLFQLTANQKQPAVTSDHSKAPTNITVNAEKATRAAGASMLALFAIFFVGAIGSCIGGYMGTKANNHNQRFQPKRR